MNLPNAPIAHEGFFATHFFTVRDQEKSKDFYVRILGGKVIKPENPCYIKLANTWIILNSGGGPTPQTTIGQLLAAELHYEFLDADTLHSAANIEEMTRGIPLTDADRAPWLTTPHARITHSFHHRENLIVACSALRQQYRDTIAYGVSLVWVYFKGSQEVIRGACWNGSTSL